ncbi:MAG TPA: TniQ family protein [Streptosporangiaceae bacterium]|nr:TniQ family protein [Streptosporangiaceae bacterium]
MLSPDRVEQIFALSAAGMPTRAIARQLGHSPQTVRAYLHQRRTPGIRAVSRPGLFTDAFADYCRQRFAEDPDLRPASLFRELTRLGFPASRSTFYRGLTRRLLSPSGRRQSQTQEQTPQGPPGTARLPAHAVALPRPVTPLTGEVLISYLTRLACANYLTLTEVLAVLPSWFSTKISNRDDRAQHHMLIPAAPEALHALARLTGTTPASLARALPAFGTAGPHSPVRATTACHRCAARHGIRQPIPVHLAAHHKVCTRHGIWLSDQGQPQLDLAACPEIITAQHRASRLLRRCTPQELMLAYQAAARTIPPWPPSPAAIPLHWRHRLLTLQTDNHRYGTPTDHDAYMHAAIYPDAIALTAARLNPSHPAGPE